MPYYENLVQPIRSLQHGRSVYFDISLHNTIQPVFISSSGFFCWGSYTTVGELAKDEKHLEAVEKVGAESVPLVLECFGLWTPFALKMLKTKCGTQSDNYITPKLAKKELAPTTFCSLWRSNAKMILSSLVLKQLIRYSTIRLYNVIRFVNTLFDYSLSL